MSIQEIAEVKKGAKLVEYCGNWWECIAVENGRLTLSNISNGDCVYFAETTLNTDKVGRFQLVDRAELRRI